ncbi:MAG: dihydropteroate synthase [Bacteroidales bacterium]
MLQKPEYINTGGKLIDLKIPRIMGIINVTPDSFYTGSRYFDDKSILQAASRMLEEGADFIDVGGYSSRPGAEDITPEEEKSRVLRAIKLITREIPEAIVSVDTFRAEIAYKAVMECGAKIINDISGGEADKEMFNVVAELNVPYILMHMQGTPRTMQINPVYNDVVADILMWFGERIFKLRTMGVKDIILDPGFGFGKTVEHNYELLRRLGEFKIAGLPIMAGLSRKSMIWKTLDVKPEDALNGTTALNMAALMNGADILRVHDVKEAVQVRTLYLKLRSKNKEGE